MTNSEYIDATNLAKVRIAFQVIQTVRPTIGDAALSESEYQNVVRILSSWMDRLENAVIAD